VLNAEINFINELISVHFNFPRDSLEVSVEIVQDNNVNRNGVYDVMKSKISLNNVDNINTLYHEVSHAIDFELFRLKKFSKLLLAFEMWKLNGYRLDSLWPVIKLNLRPFSRVSAYFYSNFTDQIVLDWQYRVTRLLIKYDKYWKEPEEVFARTMEVWFYTESLRIRHFTNHTPTFFTFFPNKIPNLSRDCTAFINNYILRMRR
jgi:hypothetical protein